MECEHNNNNHVHKGKELKDVDGKPIQHNTFSERVDLTVVEHQANCEGDEADVCSIFLDEYEVKMGRLECGHRFHEGCIKRWLLSKNHI
ncbi:hypothetical protein E3N88_19156 [Mikania micrantha]|uniref:RING-type E3 ubiquitin transferase n=1 Tax=Mikania micrantha TaxID=192012 RepID=A0A5N6NP10_9ASTR|nr:hypothetical protein E3N88_19156 [Mikania micrantha]